MNSLPSIASGIRAGRRVCVLSITQVLRQQAHEPGSESQASISFRK